MLPNTAKNTDRINRELTRIALAEQTCTELRLATPKALPHQKPQLQALEGRIALCNHRSNTWLIPDAYNNYDGTLAHATNRYWRCNSKLCPSCLAHNALLNRRKLRQALSKQNPKRNERYYFITLTIPNPDKDLIVTRSIVNYAWTLFRKRKMCASLFRGGVKSEEFTVTPRGIHYHLHAIVLSTWFLYNELRRIWTECVEASFAAYELQFNCPTVDGLLQVKIKPITPSEKSIMELCKYITKSDSWSKIGHEHLIDVAMQSRWHRMFELFGSFSDRATPQPRSVPPIVHKESLSDGGFAPCRRSWRRKVETIDVEVYLIDLEDHIAKIRQWQFRQLQYRFPNRIITDLENAHLYGLTVPTRT